MTHYRTVSDFIADKGLHAKDLSESISRIKGEINKAELDLKLFEEGTWSPSYGIPVTSSGDRVADAFKSHKSYNMWHYFAGFPDIEFISRYPYSRYSKGYTEAGLLAKVEQYAKLKRRIEDLYKLLEYTEYSCGTFKYNFTEKELRNLLKASNAVLGAALDVAVRVSGAKELYIWCTKLNLDWGWELESCGQASKEEKMYEISWDGIRENPDTVTIISIPQVEHTSFPGTLVFNDSTLKYMPDTGNTLNLWSPR